MKNKLYLISHEKISQTDRSFFCDNIDMKSIPEELNNEFEVNIIARKSKTQRQKNINIENISIHSNFISYILSVLKSFKALNSNFLIISLSPNTFLAAIFCILARKKFYLYLRSDGFEEYKQKIGIFGYYIYKLMFFLVCSKAKLITCHKKLLKEKKGEILKPSQLDDNWFVKIKKADLQSIKLLYIGRIRVEKGVFSLIEILSKLSVRFTFTIIANEKINNLKEQKNFMNVLSISDHKLLIEAYDNHNIFILPSFTEGYSQVIDESLARGRPVIVFKEISDIVFENRKGVFVSERNVESLQKTINYIMENYNEIINLISSNVLPTKQKFIKSLIKILKG